MYFDAHNHLHDARLAPFRAALLKELPGLGVSGAIVNGTTESDWEEVAALCAAHSWLRPAFGLHPWWVGGRTPDWEKRLLEMLNRHPQASLGETGLDCWIEGHDVEDQKKVFCRQLAIAREGDRAITVHCLKAHEPLRQVLTKHAGPPRGFLMHAWSGPASLTDFLLERGARFSFPLYFMHERKGAQRELFRTLPLERILVETDAPDLVPPDDWNRHPLTDVATGMALHHPGTIVDAYAALGELRGIPGRELVTAVQRNWQALFGHPGSD